VTTVTQDERVGGTKQSGSNQRIR